MLKRDNPSIVAFIIALWLAGPAFSQGCAAHEPFTGDFVTLCLDGSAKDVARALKAGADPNQPNLTGYSPLDAAAMSPNPQSLRILKSLLEAGADPAKPNRYGDYPIIMASASKEASFEKTLALLEKGADPRAKNQMGQTALHMLAQEGGSVALLDMLVKAGALADAPENRGHSPLMYLLIAPPEPSQEGMPLFESFIAAGADVNRRAHSGATPLMLAAGTEKLKESQRLLSLGAKVDFQDRQSRTALMVAARRSSGTESIRLLLAAGASPWKMDNRKETALAYAQKNQTPMKEKIIRILKEAMASQRP